MQCGGPAEIAVSAKDQNPHSNVLWSTSGGSATSAARLRLGPFGSVMTSL